MSQCMRFPTMRYVRPAGPQIGLRIRTVWSEPLVVAWVFYDCYKLLTEHHLEFLSLKGGCRGSSESTHVKMTHCWKSHALAQISVVWLSKVKPQSLRELASQFASNKNNHTTLLRSTLLEQLLLYHLQTLCKTVYMYLLEGLMED